VYKILLSKALAKVLLWNNVKFVSENVTDNVSVKKRNALQIEIYYIILHLLSLHYNQYTKLISPIVFPL